MHNILVHIRDNFLYWLIAVAGTVIVTSVVYPTLMKHINIDARGNELPYMNKEIDPQELMREWREKQSQDRL